MAGTFYLMIIWCLITAKYSQWVQVSKKWVTTGLAWKIQMTGTILFDYFWLFNFYFYLLLLMYLMNLMIVAVICSLNCRTQFWQQWLFSSSSSESQSISRPPGCPECQWAVRDAQSDPARPVTSIQHDSDCGCGSPGSVSRDKILRECPSKP